MFNGLASFYRKFIRNFSVVGNAMTETMRGDKKISSEHMEQTRVLKL